MQRWHEQFVGVGHPHDWSRRRALGHEGVGDELAGNYSSYEDSALTSPAIDLSAYGGQWLVVTWWQWLQSQRSD